MGIPEEQLKAWSDRGALKGSEDTYASIRCALERFAGWPDGVDYEVYLQGSYRNYTNTRGDSDVDVVVQLNSTFYRDLALLSPDEAARYERDHSNASYQWSAFREDVLKALWDYYGRDRAAEGKKSLKVETPYLPADVVPCLQYRKYTSYPNLSGQRYIEGMTFYVPTETRWVVNYPKLHYQSGNDKQAATADWFKPTVRVFKNARNKLVDLGQVDDKLTPSYFVECLLYNVPNDRYGESYQLTFVSALKWFLEADRSKLLCQNGQSLLFGSSPEQWRESAPINFAAALIALWEVWDS